MVAAIVMSGVAVLVVVFAVAKWIDTRPTSPDDWRSLLSKDRPQSATAVSSHHAPGLVSRCSTLTQYSRRRLCLSLNDERVPAGTCIALESFLLSTFRRTASGRPILVVHVRVDAAPTGAKAAPRSRARLNWILGIGVRAPGRIGASGKIERQRSCLESMGGNAMVHRNQRIRRRPP
jgi:hypothetical protein